MPESVREWALDVKRRERRDRRSGFEPGSGSRLQEVVAGSQIFTSQTHVRMGLSVREGVVC